MCIRDSPSDQAQRFKTRQFWHEQAQQSFPFQTVLSPSLRQCAFQTFFTSVRGAIAPFSIRR